MIFLAILIFVIYKLVTGINGESVFGGEAEQAPAVVTAKRMDVFGGERTSVRYYATFELEDGSRKELSLSGSDYGSLAEGDRGTLKFAGGRFRAFLRSESRFSAEDPDKAVHRCPACGATYTGRVCEYCDTPWVEPAKK